MTDISKVLDIRFRGNVLIAKGNDIIFESCGGMRDLANGIPNDRDTRFETASGSKTFVAAGILKLIEQGQFGFDDAIGGLLKTELYDIDCEVTVKQLLTHTSGIPDYFDESVMDDYEALWKDIPNYRMKTTADMLRLFIKKPMMYPRGERFQYNNSGYILLALIIEELTGMAFDEYLAKEIFAPCGMERTGYYEFDRLPGGCANVYIHCDEDGGFRTNIYSVEAKGSGAGGAFTTARDIYKFWRALIEGKLLSGEMFARMISKQSGDGSDPEEGWYGCGMWIIDNPGGRDIAYMQGADDGASFLAEYCPDRDIVSVLVSNYGDNVWAEMRKLRKALYV